jgi:hypothetical protein
MIQFRNMSDRSARQAGPHHGSRPYSCARIIDASAAARELDMIDCGTAMANVVRQ